MAPCEGGDFTGEMVTFKGLTWGPQLPCVGTRIRTQISQGCVSIVSASILVKHGKGGGWREMGRPEGGE